MNYNLLWKNYLVHIESIMGLGWVSLKDHQGLSRTNNRWTKITSLRHKEKLKGLWVAYRIKKKKATNLIETAKYFQLTIKSIWLNKFRKN